MDVIFLTHWKLSYHIGVNQKCKFPDLVIFGRYMENQEVRNYISFQSVICKLAATAEPLEHISCEAGTRPVSNWTNSAAADLSKLIFETELYKNLFALYAHFFLNLVITRQIIGKLKISNTFLLNTTGLQLLSRLWDSYQTNNFYS